MTTLISAALLRRYSLGLIAAASLLAGCAATPFQSPAVQVPGQWQQGAGQPTSGSQVAQRDRWWASLADAQLTALIDLALQRNNNLAAAAYRVRNAQLQAGNALGNRFPTPEARVSVGTREVLESGSRSLRTDSASIGVSWEADLWGRLSAAQRASDWEAAATEMDRQAVAQALIGTVASTYWQLAVAESRLASQQQSLARANRTLELVNVQYQAGAISGLELAQARQTQASQQAQISRYRQQIVELRNAMALLFDSAPDQLPAEAQRPRLPDTRVLPEIPAGLPSELLGRRPDLLAAEMRLRSTLANADQVRASYYPALSLTGALGAQSGDLSTLLQNPIATLGAGLTLPFLRFGEMRRNTAIAQNQYEQAIIDFRQTLYQAYADVENALAGRRNLADQETQLRRSLQQAARTEELMEVRYRAGAVALKLWLDAQETRRSAQLALQDIQLERLSNLVALYQALGGSPVLQAVPLPEARPKVGNTGLFPTQLAPTS